MKRNRETKKDRKKSKVKKYYNNKNNETPGISEIWLRNIKVAKISLSIEIKKKKIQI